MASIEELLRDKGFTRPKVARRSDSRAHDEIRQARITRDYIKHALGSCLIEIGDTRVICAASVENKVPPHIKNTGTGWITAEYGMLPASTNTRTARESSRGRTKGRTCLLYTSDAADDLLCVDLGGPRIIKKKN